MGNILDKTDKSLAPTPSGVSTLKREKFRWYQGARIGTFTMILKQLLNIDGSYQRGEVSRAKVSEIARNWDWVLFGAITVVLREDGTYWVIDGGHRVRASFFRDDVSSLPCMVYEIGDLSDEAKAFIGRNLMVSSVSAIDRFKASAVAEEPAALKTAAILKAYGLSVKNTATERHELKCVGAICRAVEDDAATAEKVLAFCVAIADDKSLSGSVFRGMYWLVKRLDIDILGVYGDRLTCHSQKEIEIAIRQSKAELGKGGEAVEAFAILKMVNKGLKKRIPFPGKL